MFLKAWIFLTALWLIQSSVSEGARREFRLIDAEPITTLPPIPASLSQKGRARTFNLIDVWEQRLKEQKNVASTALSPQLQLRTVILVPPSKMLTLVPQDTPNPLYASAFGKMTDEFIQDYLSGGFVNFQDPTLATSSGFTMKTMNGKDLVFKKNAQTGKLTLNGVEVLRHQLLSDHTNIILIADFLFNHFNDIQNAQKTLTGTPQHSRVESNNQHQGKKQTTYVLPRVPAVLRTPRLSNDVSELLNLWEDRLSQRDRTKSHLTREDPNFKPKTIVVVTPLKMASIVPRDEFNPLNAKGYEQMTDEFILDYLSMETIDLNDPSLESVNGVTLKTMSGKDLVFKKNDQTGNIAVNGVDVEKHHLLRDRSTVIIISDFLFDHYNKVQNAYRAVLQTSQGQSGLHRERVKLKRVTALVPRVPTSLKSAESRLGVPEFLSVWENRLLRRDRRKPHLSQSDPSFIPKTIIAVTSSKMRNLIPQDTSNPLYAEGYEELTDKFLLDHFSKDTIDFNDRRLSTPAGITLKTLSGKDLNFKKNLLTSQVTVNGVDIEKHHLLSDRTNVIIISDFLFDHYDEVQNAFRTLLQTSQLGGHQKNEEIKHKTTVVPTIPSSLKNDESRGEVSGLLNVWESRLEDIDRNEPHLSKDDPALRPKTVLSVTPSRMVNLVPQDAPNPLYAPSYKHLTNEFISDHLSRETVDFNDRRLSSRAGITLKSLSGKDLVFKKNLHTGKTTVNGIEIEKHHLLNDQTNIIIISDFLFDHYDKVQNAFKTLLTTTQGQFGLHREREELKQTTTVIPRVPTSLKNDAPRMEVSGLLNVWESRLEDIDRNEPHLSKDDPASRPKTVLSVTPSRMVNLVPQDAPNPLYAPSYKHLTNEFISDHLSRETIDFNDRRLSSRAGITLKSLSGKDLVFKKNLHTGKTTVNGIEIEKNHLLNDQTNIIIISDFLFDHYDKVQNAFKTLLTTTQGQFGLHREREELKQTTTVIPKVPTSLKNDASRMEVSGLLNVWESRLEDIDRNEPHLSRDDLASRPKTVLSVTPSRMVNLVPQDAPNPLYAPSYKHLTNEFISDHLSRETIDFNDRRLSSRAGITLKSLSGKDLVFKKNLHTGKTTVNGIEIEKNHLLNDQTNIIIISDFLFDHYDKVQNAFKTLLTTTQGQFGLHREREKLKQTTTVIPKVPTSLKNDASRMEVSGLLNVWESRLEDIDRNEPHLSRDDLASRPKTVLSVTPLRMVNLVPQDAPNPLYAPSYKHLTNEFISDHLSRETIDFNDRRLSSRAGITLKSLSGKDLVFKKNLHTGKTTVNGIEIEKNHLLNDQTNIIIISDFLFDHYDKVQNAFKTLLTTTQGQFGLHREREELKQTTTVIPKVPTSLKNDASRMEVSGLLNVWENRLEDIDRNEPHLSKDDPDSRPKTVLSVTPSRMVNLVPQDAPNPLYAPSYKHLTNEFISDHLSRETIDFNDRRLSSRAGITLKSLSGKDLVFKKNLHTGKTTVNGIEIEKHHLLNDQTNIIIISDFLFDHYDKVQNAFKTLLTTTQGQFGLHREREELKKTTTVIPRVPTSLKNDASRMEVSGLLGVWENRLEQRDGSEPHLSKDDRALRPKTVLSVTPSRMVNLVPQDAPHPLYAPTYKHLTDEFISDHLSRETIDFDDRRLSSRTGITLKTLSGKDLVFKKNLHTGKTTVNGIEIEKHHLLNDQTNIIIISDFLFDHYDKVQNTFKTLLTTTQRQFGLHREREELKQTTTVIPRLPTSLKNDASRMEVSGLLNVWENRLEDIDRNEPHLSRDDLASRPKTVLSVTPSRMVNLVPQDAPNPLYAPSYKHLTNEFISDHLSRETIDFNDRRLSSRAGITLKSLSKKDLVFKKNLHTGKTSVNGIEIEKHHLLNDQTNIIIISDFLFDHYDKVQNAFTTLLTTTQGQFGLHGKREELKPTTTVVPRVPTSLKNDASRMEVSGLLGVWKNRLEQRDRSEPHLSKDDRALRPKTVLSVTPSRMVNLVPQDAPHPLYAPTYKHLTDEFISDHLSRETIDFDDRRLSSRTGITLKTLSGKDLVFKKNLHTGKTTVNGIEIEKHHLLNDQTNIIIISDFLFDHYDKVQNAFKTLLTTTQGQFGMHREREELKKTTTVVPRVPTSLKNDASRMDVSGLLNVWENRLEDIDRNEPHLSTDDLASRPKTVLSVTPSRMVNLVPQDAPNPLYAPSYKHLTNEFISDHLSRETIDFNDRRLSSRAGITLKSLSGKDLVFKKNLHTGKTTVNGIEIEKNHLLNDQTNIIIISDFLFDHYDKVQNAFKTLLTTTQGQFGLHGEREELKQITTPVPRVPTSLKNDASRMEVSGLLGVWENRLEQRDRNEPHLSKDDRALRPKTVLSVTPSRMVNLVPQDAPHPLYAPTYKHLTDEFISDHLSRETIDFDDRRLSSRTGITLKTLSGKDLVFKKNLHTGKTSVNGIEIEKHHLLNDQTNIIIISDFLFDHYDKVQNAFTTLLTTTQGQFGLHGKREELKPTTTVVPRVPTSLKNDASRMEVSGLLGVWKNRLEQRDRSEPHLSKDDRALRPKTVLSVTPSRMVNLVPQDAPHPLYAPTYKHLTDEFISDHLSRETIDFDDRRLSSRTGITLKTLSGKDLVFKKNLHTGKTTVNGIEIEKHHLLNDQTNIIIISDFLFDHYDKVQNAFKTLLTTTQGQFGMHREREELKKTTTVVPRVPTSLKNDASRMDVSGLLNVWENRLEDIDRNEPHLSTDDLASRPKTVLSVTPSRMVNLVPQDAPNPLYAPSYKHLTNEFISDHLSRETIDFNDRRLSSRAGITLKSLSGKDLVFKKNLHTGKTTVNGIEIEKNHLLNDQTNIIIISDFLFDHYDKVQNAFKTLLTTTQGQFGLHGEREELKQITTPVPRVPTSLKNDASRMEVSGLLGVWENRLEQRDRNEPHLSKDDRALRPKTVLSVTPSRMVNLVPQDAPHPLYAPTYKHLTDEFISDHLSRETIDFDDRRLSSRTGITLKTLSGKDLVFKKNLHTGKTTVNGIEIEKHHLLNDQTNIIIISDFLFDHYDKVQNAFKTLLTTTQRQFGLHREREELKQTTSLVPRVPTSLKNDASRMEVSGLLNVWENRLEDIDRNEPHLSKDDLASRPKTVLSVTPSRMVNLVPQDAPNPLYAPSYKHLTNEFISDHLSRETIDFNDRRLSSRAGITLKSLSGKDLVFKKNLHTGKTTVNGIEIEKHHLLNDQTNIIIISDFLFDHYDKVQNAFKTLLTTTQGQFGMHREREELKPPTTVVPRVPTSLKNDASKMEVSGLLNVWENRLEDIDRNEPHLSTDDPASRPKTVLSVTSSRMVNLVPRDAPHPLYAPSYKHLTNEFISDHLSRETVDFNDRRLSSRAGITLKSLSGKDLVFKKNLHTGKTTVNGIEIEKHHLLNDQTNIIIISDFLFDHYDQVQNAYKTLLTTTQGQFGMHREREELKPPTTVVPRVPTSLKNDASRMEVSGLLNVWENRLEDIDRNEPHLSTDDPASRPKTVLSVTPSRMVNLVPQDAPNPLYAPSYKHLTDEFISDHLSRETLDFNHRRLSSRAGITLKSLSGKDLVFKKNLHTGQITINGVNLVKNFFLKDNTNVIIISDFLFDHYNEVQKAFQDLLRTSHKQFGLHGEREKLKLKTMGFPRIPSSLKNAESRKEVSWLLDMWENHLIERNRNEPHFSKDTQTLQPNTILAVTSSRMNSLIPQDVPNPLYAPRFKQMTEEIILDHLSKDTIDFNDPRLSSPRGITFKTMSGKDLVFKKDFTTGKLTVNGVHITKHYFLRDHTNLIIISDLLFDNYDSIHNAIRTSFPGSSQQVVRHEGHSELKYKSNTVPPVPLSLKAPASMVGLNDFIDLWENRLFWIDRRQNMPSFHNTQRSQVKTLLIVTPSTMRKLIPPNAPNPLYTPGYEQTTDTFILDHLSEDTIDFSDQRLSTPAGITLRTMNGKNLVFKRSFRTGMTSVNGVDIERHQQLGNTNVIIIDDFLFNHYQDIRNIFTSFCRNLKL